MDVQSDSTEPDGNSELHENTLSSLNHPEPEGDLSIERFWELFKNSGLLQALLFLAVLNNVIWAYRAATARYHENDFAHYYVSSRLLLSQQDDLYRMDLRPEYKKLGWENLQEPIFYPTNPPSLIALFSVYARLPPRAAHLAWMLTQLAALCVVIRLTYEAVRDRISGQGYTLILAIFLLLPFVKAHLIYSQVQLLLFALVMLGFRLQQQNHGWIGCLFVAAAALLKLYPVVLLPWFVWRSGCTPATRVAAGAISTISLLAGVWLTDFALWKEFFEIAKPHVVDWVGASQCFTLSSLSVHLGAIASGESDNRVFFQIGMISGILMLSLFFIWIWRRDVKGSPQDAASELAILILLMLFCGVTCWWHYLVFLLFPMAVAATYLTDGLNARKLIACTVVAAMMLRLTSSNQFGDLPTLLLLFSPIFGMIAITIFLVVSYHSFKRPQPIGSSNGS